MQKQIGDSDGQRNIEKSGKTPLIKKNTFIFRKMWYTIIYLK